MVSLPKKPSEVDVKVIKEMFEASVDGEAYDQDKFGQYFRPQVLVQEQVIPIQQKSFEVKSTPVAETKIKRCPWLQQLIINREVRLKTSLAMIRARQQK